MTDNHKPLLYKFENKGSDTGPGKIIIWNKISDKLPPKDGFVITKWYRTDGKVVYHKTLGYLLQDISDYNKDIEYVEYSEERLNFLNSQYSDRGTGRTTNQILYAPLNSVFVWCNERIDYPKDLARKLGRNDLKIVGTSILDHEGQRLRGITNDVILDHATELNDEQYFAYRRHVWIQKMRKS